MARDSLESLDRLRNLLEEARIEGRTAAPAVPFDMLAGVEDALRDAQHRYPRVMFDRDIQCGNNGFTTSQFTLFGGELTFARMLSNLLLNACQGDGQSGAHHVRVAVSVAECGQGWELRVSDDGPGFSHAQIGGPIVGFQTTKASGTGLGLFVVERLAAANGGVVRRGNNPQRGAWVSLSFAQQVAGA
jgi:C4-dicarboxylate-specific signal transduction histidine kinase